MDKAKPFSISKREVWEAIKRVKANQGAAGVDGQSIADFGANLAGNLYKLWNRMSSGSYVPPPVKAAEIPKPHGGTRILGVPTVGDRIAQTVAALQLEARTESIFHADSYGYRPGKSAHDALARWAADELRSTNAQIEMVLRRGLDDAGRLPAKLAPVRRPGRPRKEEPEG